MLLDDILTPNYFTVEIDCIQNDRFFICEGIEMATNLHEIEEGGLNTTTHKHIAGNRSPRLVLKKGVTKNSEVVNWFWRNIEKKNKFERKNISIVLMNSALEEIRRWDLYRAFPCKWKLDILDVNDNTYLVETIEIAYG